MGLAAYGYLKANTSLAPMYSRNIKHTTVTQNLQPFNKTNGDKKIK